MKKIDLRSDTVTQPTKTMRKAMADARVGDDVFGEDPTVVQLEGMAARITGKEAALFTASGTMANLISQLVHCGRGEEMILGDQSHIFFYEQGGSAAVGGIHPRTLPNHSDGTLSLEEIAAAIRDDNVHFPKTRLIVLENTHNRCNGTPLPMEYMAAVGHLAQKYDLKIHVDGARIFNASAALATPVADLCREADSVSFCLSKGLCAPVGSLVCGSSGFIYRARRARKLLGGGMRQAGILAAAGIVALTEMTERLPADHDNAQTLARGLSNLPHIIIDPTEIKTNIVYIGIKGSGPTAEALCNKLDKKGVRVLPTGQRQIRAVTHYPITEQDIEEVISVFAELL